MKTVRSWRVERFDPKGTPERARASPPRAKMRTRFMDLWDKGVEGSASMKTRDRFLADEASGVSEVGVLRGIRESRSGEGRLGCRRCGTGDRRVCETSIKTNPRVVEVRRERVGMV